MSMAIKYQMQKKAKGGCISKKEQDDKHAERRENSSGKDKGVHETLGYQEIKKDERKGQSLAGRSVRHANREGISDGPKKAHLEHAKNEHARVLSELKSMKRPHGEYAEGGDVMARDDMDSDHVPSSRQESAACKACGYAEGGDVIPTMDHADHPEDHDMIGSIMKKRMAEGGIMANATPPDVEFEDNEFDNLVKMNPDTKKADYTAKNSGDEEGDERLDEDEEDIVSSTMKSRKKKDRLPNPR